jgi:hypothetical protein
MRSIANPRPPNRTSRSTTTNATRSKGNAEDEIQCRPRQCIVIVVVVVFVVVDLQVNNVSNSLPPRAPPPSLSISLSPPFPPRYLYYSIVYGGRLDIESINMREFFCSKTGRGRRVAFRTPPPPERDAGSERTNIWTSLSNRWGSAVVRSPRPISDDWTGQLANAGASCRMMGNEREWMVLSGGRVSEDVLPNPDGDEG